MEPSIPIPTDNIYKFYALCGLAIFVSSILASAYVFTSYLERIASTSIELEMLKTKNDLSSEEAVKKSALEGRLVLDQTLGESFFKLLSVACAVGLLGMIVGFSMWQIRIQPKQDQLLDLQAKKIEHEVRILARTLEQTSADPAPSPPLS
jgi:hypothetical protein